MAINVVRSAGLLVPVLSCSLLACADSDGRTETFATLEGSEATTDNPTTDATTEDDETEVGTDESSGTEDTGEEPKLDMPEEPGPIDTCLEYIGLVEDWTGDPPATPNTRRAHGVEIIDWQGTPYLFSNFGNGFRVYDISDPTDPALEAIELQSCFGPCLVTPPGDYDWSLYNFSICDDCRYGVAQHFIAGTVLFDLGDGPVPGFVDSEAHLAANGTEGAFTFEHEGQQYLIITGHEGGCGFAPSYGSTLYTFDGVTQADLENIQCLEDGNGSSFKVLNGRYVRDEQGNAYVFVIAAMGKVHVYAINGTGADLQLSLVDSSMSGFSKLGTGFKVHGDLVASAMSSNLFLYDVQDPGAPVELDVGLSDMLGGETVGAAAFHYPLLWVGKRASEEAFTFDLSDLDAPVPYQQDFWALDQPWNSEEQLPYIANFDGNFSPDGSVLYIARYSVLQAFSTVGECP